MFMSQKKRLFKKSKDWSAHKNSAHAHSSLTLEKHRSRSLIAHFKILPLSLTEKVSDRSERSKMTAALQCSAYHAMPSNAMQFLSMRFNALQCPAMPCNALQCPAIPCNAIAKPWNALSSQERIPRVGLVIVSPSFWFSWLGSSFETFF